MSDLAPIDSSVVDPFQGSSSYIHHKCQQLHLMLQPLGTIKAENTSLIRSRDWPLPFDCIRYEVRIIITNQVSQVRSETMYSARSALISRQSWVS